MRLEDIKQLTKNIIDPTSPNLQEEIYAFLIERGYNLDHVYQELEMSSRFVDTHQDVSYINTIMQLHSHSFYEIIYCKNSCLAEYIIDSQRYRLQRGDIIVIPPGVSHRPILPEKLIEPYKRDVLWISTEFLEQVKKLFHDSNCFNENQFYVFRSANTNWEYLGELFHKGVMESETQDDGWQASIMGNAMMILTHLNRALNDKNTTKMKVENTELLDQITSHVEKHLQDKITLSDIAHRFFVSEATITSTFRHKMGTSFYRYVTQRRLIAAKSLILKGLSLESIALQVGFLDYSTFYRAFKHEFGISPREYRKLQEVEYEQPLFL